MSPLIRIREPEQEPLTETCPFSLLGHQHRQIDLPHRIGLCPSFHLRARHLLLSSTEACQHKCRGDQVRMSLRNYSFCNCQNPISITRLYFESLFLGSLGDNRYSPTSAMRSNAFTSPPSSAGRGGMGSATPMLPRGILRNTANGTRSGRLSRGGLSPATYSPPTSISDAQTLTESIERAARITESVYSKDSQYPSLFQALVGNDQLGGNAVNSLIVKFDPIVR